MAIKTTRSKAPAPVTSLSVHSTKARKSRKADLPVGAKSGRLKTQRTLAPVEAKARTITVLPSGSEQRVLNRLTADLGKARRRFAVALDQNKSKFFSERHSILHAPENGNYFEQHKKQWIQDVCASLANRLDQLINLQQQTRRSEAVDRAAQLMAPVVNEECNERNLFNVLRHIVMFGEYLPRGIPELYGRDSDSLTIDVLSKLLARLVQSQFNEIIEDAMVCAEQPVHGNKASEKLPAKQTIEGKQEALPPKQQPKVIKDRRPNANDRQMANKKCADPARYPHMTAREVAARMGISLQSVYEHPGLEEKRTGTRKRLWTTNSVLAIEISEPE